MRDGRNAYPDSHSNRDSNGDCCTHRYGHGHSDSYASNVTHSDCYCDGYRNGNVIRYCNCDCDGCAYRDSYCDRDGCAYSDGHSHSHCYSDACQLTDCDGDVNPDRYSYRDRYAC